jgi:hypothetical protein
MSLWEYKVITSGKGGFATPALLEKFLNDLGREEWEIVQFHTQPDNFLAFTGLARRTTQRDWTLEDAAAAAAKAEADKLRAEFEAKFKAGASTAPATTEERAPSFLEEKTGADDGFRKPVDTSRDDEPEVAEEADDWDKLTAAEEDELPSFFDAIKPHMRRNQRGPGMSVGVDYLAKKWDQTEEDLRGALAECGFVMPVDEDSKAEYLEYDGDLYWLNINRRGELWINTKEKPRPVFRAVKGFRVESEAAPQAERPAGESAPAAEGSAPAARPEGQEARPEEPRGTPVPLPEGTALLEKIRPHMRRNRRGPGGSGSASFLSRALRTTEADLRQAFAGLGLVMPASAADKPVYTELDGQLWWLNLDSRGGLWINGRDKGPDEPAAGEAAPVAASAEPAAAVPADSSGPVVAEAAPAQPVPANPAPAEPAASAEAAAAPASNPTFAAVRPLLEETKGGVWAASVEQLAERLGRKVDELVASLVAAGLKLPEKPREKAVQVEQSGEVFWLSLNGKGDLLVQAKAAKRDEDDSEDEGGGDKPSRGRRGRGRGRK